MIPIRHVAIVSAALAIGIPMSSAHAQNMGPAGWFVANAAIKACGGDVRRLCDNVVPGGGRIAQCLVAQPEKLSAPCHEFADKAKTTRNAALACTTDAHRLCGDMMPGGGRIVACLNRQRNALSPDCSSALDEIAAALKR